MTMERLSTRSLVSRALIAGIVAGTVDIGAACLINGAPPFVILHVIASGLIGKSAFDGGLTTVVLGLLLQWAMSMIIAAIFIVAMRRWPALGRRWIASGLAYGAPVYFVMNYVVLPLSAIGHAPRFRLAHFAEDMAAMLLFGLIVAFFARPRLAG
jgi:uncharacterized membrane protein YagU involved in acid resistance